MSLSAFSGFSFCLSHALTTVPISMFKTRRLVMFSSLVFIKGKSKVNSEGEEGSKPPKNVTAFWSFGLFSLNWRLLSPPLHENSCIAVGFLLHFLLYFQISRKCAPLFRVFVRDRQWTWNCSSGLSWKEMKGNLSLTLGQLCENLTGRAGLQSSCLTEAADGSTVLSNAVSSVGALQGLRLGYSSGPVKREGDLPLFSCLPP